MKILILFLILLTNGANAQIQSSIGFSCGYTGNPSELVIFMDRLLENEDYNTIKKKLSSFDNGTRFIAVVLCEILQEKGLISLSQTEKNKILRAYKSKSEISLCSGCTYNGKTSMKNVLNEVDFDEWGINFKQMAKDRYKYKIENKTGK